GLTQLAPAYDLLSTRLVIPEKDDPEELALTMNGRKRKFRIGDFQQLAKSLKLKQKQVDNIFKRFQKVMPTVLDFINNSFLPEDKKSEYKELIQERASRLFT
ncbi:HipA domain-containing protein, partial [Marinilabiliaceae bacterium AAT]|nr:HipA domain-containing protein [Plebeiobacterium sediminum]